MRKQIQGIALILFGILLTLTFEVMGTRNNNIVLPAVIHGALDFL